MNPNFQDAVERLDAENTQDTFQVVLHQQRYEFALARISAQDALLEIGTGMGCFSGMAAKRCKDYTGLEFDARACETTRQRLQGAGNVIQGDAQATPFPSQAFSVITCLEVLEHLQNYRKAVAEIHRCLQPAGQAIVSVPYRRRGGPNPMNRFHLYEPGEAELTAEFRRYFAQVGVFYQYFEETPLMTLARVAHLRSVLGLASVYASLIRGEPEQTSKLRIASRPRGWKVSLVLHATEPRPRPAGANGTIAPPSQNR